jgi:hypothetical protein
MSTRTMLRAMAAVMLSMLVAFGLAGQAYAHPDITNMECVPASNARIWCAVFYSGAHEPVRIRWYFNGVHDPRFDDDRYILRGCELGKTVYVKAVVSDIHGSDSLTDHVRCGGTPQ